MKNIGWMLRQRATVSPRLQAYVEPSTDVRMTYAQMNALANRCADVLTALGIAKGDRVALLMASSMSAVMAAIQAPTGRFRRWRSRHLT